MAFTKSVTPSGQALAILQSNGKYALNPTLSTMPAGTVCSWHPGGVLQLANAADMTADTFAGVVFQDILPGQFGLVLRRGKAPGVIAGLVPTAGQPIFLSLTPGQLTLDTSSFSESDAIVRIGYAEPPDNAVGVATDLLIEFELIASI
jgi:hypothetical protein